MSDCRFGVSPVTILILILSRPTFPKEYIKISVITFGLNWNENEHKIEQLNGEPKQWLMMVRVVHRKTTAFTLPTRIAE